jgi:hypothetical protein
MDGAFLLPGITPTSKTWPCCTDTRKHSLLQKFGVVIEGEAARVA